MTGMTIISCATDCALMCWGVTGACLMVKKSTYEAAGGLSETLGWHLMMWNCVIIYMIWVMSTL